MCRLTLKLLIAATVLLAETQLDAAKLDGRGFPSANAAAQALIGAAKNDDVAGLIAILGPSSKEILMTSDSVADRQVRQKFVKRALERMKVISDPGNPKAKELLVGKDEWPLPIPIVQEKGKWYFDIERGKHEILLRRIGGNELDAIEVCRGYVEAQNNYADMDPTQSGVRQFAQKIISSPGKRDGLFWISSDSNDVSPISDIVSRAFEEGYTTKRAPYHGYYFKVLTAQGPHASGGEMSYLDDGLMRRGFALIAWPSTYRATGIMTFLVDKSGIVFQKDLGPQTPKIAGAYSAYDPDDTWMPVSTSARK